MKKFLSLVLMVFLAVVALVGCNEEATANKQKTVEESNGGNVTEVNDYPKTFTDGRGKEITLNEKPSRIVSTTLAIDEYLLALVETNRIAAVTQLSTDPGISNVAGLTDPIETKIESLTAELVISLNPDLVLLPTYSNPEVVEQLDKANIVTYQLKDDASFDGILAGVEEVGALVGEEEKAADLVSNIKERMSDLKDQSTNNKKRVLYWTEYNSSVTDNTSIGEMINLAGGLNVITEAGITGDEYPDYPSLSKEKVIELNPDVIITSIWTGTDQQSTIIDEWKKDPALQNVAAIKNNAVYAIDSANLTTASHYVIEGAEDIYNVLYGE